GGYSALASYIRQARSQAERERRVFILVDGGNSLVGSAEANFYKGAVSVEFMNRVGYDSITVSNLDFSLGKKVVKELAGQARFPFLNANLLETATGKNPPYIKPYTMVEAEGLKIGIVGYGQRNISGWVDPDKVKGLKGVRIAPLLRKTIAEMTKAGAELIIAVDHSAGNNYREIARSVDGIDILIDGASEWASVYTKNFTLEEPTRIGGTYIFPEVDSHFAVGRIDLNYDKSSRKIEDARGERYFMIAGESSDDPEIRAMVDDYAERMAGNRLQEVIGRATEDISKDWDENWNSPLGTLVCRAMRQYAHTDAAIENLGAIRRYLKQGPITLRDIHDILPFDNKLVTFKVKGRYIYDCSLLQMLAGAVDRVPWIYIDGARLDRGPDLRVKHITIGGREIEKNRVYTFATNSYLYNSDYLDKRVCKDIQVREEDITDLVIDYIRNHSPISPPEEEIRDQGGEMPPAKFTSPSPPAVAESSSTVSSYNKVRRSGKPIPSGPGVYLNKQYRKKVLDFSRRTMVDAYRSVGRRDPRWDEAAIEYLEKFA
ncbi:MAG TPA: bifunctional metallophosphatase/5'-nucleotidase, partial [Proteobacteria bacterium]|nr:bifunctional metallophosphatase/5'-nucleotidase [Pseudomonadota bacterium]